MIGFYILIGVISLVSWLISNTLKKKFEKYSKVSLSVTFSLKRKSRLFKTGLK